MKAVVATLRFLLSHPLNRNHRLKALARYLRWQIGSRIAPGPVAVPFVNGCVLLAEPGMTGATGNIYCGLDELESMALVGHALRPGDLFVDVGANIGSYTVLAASTGAECLAFEPIPATFRNLERNIRVNDISNVVAIEAAAGSKSGTVRMTQTFDTVNHVISDAEEPGFEAKVWRLDDRVTADRPFGVKVDVEGWEQEVLAGATTILASPLLLFVVAEVNGSGNRYGFSDDTVLKVLASSGLTQVRYNPWTRVLRPSDELAEGNVLFVRLPQVADRVHDAGPIVIGNGEMI